LNVTDYWSEQIYRYLYNNNLMGKVDTIISNMATLTTLLRYCLYAGL